MKAKLSHEFTCHWLAIVFACFITVVPSSSTLICANMPLAGIRFDSGSGYHYFDKSADFDTLIIATTNSIFEKAVSPGNTKLALSYRLGSSVYVAIVNHRPFKFNVVANSPNAALVAMAWRDEKTLGFNFMNQKKEGDKYVFQNMGSYSVNSDSLKANYLKFNNGSSIVAWLPSGLLVTRYDQTYYIINTTTGKPVSTFSGVDKCSFSPDGKKCLYYQGTAVTDDNGRESTIPELFIADYDGKNAKKVVSYMDYPQHATWSPDGQTVALDIKSRKWANVRYLAFCNVQTGKTVVQKNDDVSRSDPRYSPNGSRLFYYETETTVVNGSKAIRAIVRTEVDQATVSLSEGIVGDAYHSPGSFLAWYDDHILGLATNAGTDITSVTSQMKVLVPGILVHCWTW